jgi:hypothetical protein
MKEYFARQRGTNTFDSPAFSANLELWLDLSDISTMTLNGGDISQIDDKSGNNRHATQVTASEQPAYSLGTQNGRNAATLDGVDEWLAGPILDVFRQPYTIFMVISLSAASQSFFAWTEGGGHGLNLSSSNQANKIRALHRFPYGSVGGDDTVSSATYVYGTPVLFTVVRDSGFNEEVFFNGVSVGTLAGSDNFFNTPGNGYAIGRLGITLAGRYTNGNFNELAVYSRELPAQERSSRENGLIRKWGL